MSLITLHSNFNYENNLSLILLLLGCNIFFSYLYSYKIIVKCQYIIFMVYINVLFNDSCYSYLNLGFFP